MQHDGPWFLACSLIYGFVAAAIALVTARRPWRLMPLLRAAWRWKREAIKAHREYMREGVQRTIFERIAWAGAGELRRQVELNEELQKRLDAAEFELAKHKIPEGM